MKQQILGPHVYHSAQSPQQDTIDWVLKQKKCYLKKFLELLVVNLTLCFFKVIQKSFPKEFHKVGILSSVTEEYRKRGEMQC